MPAKNRLQTPDAQAVEAAFEEKLARFEAAGIGRARSGADRRRPSERSPIASHPRRRSRVLRRDGRPPDPPRRPVAPKTIRLAIRIIANSSRNRPAPCAADRRRRRITFAFMQPRALGRKVSDEFIVPVCRLHHRELHRHGDEQAWWRELNIDPVAIALALWRKTRSRPDRPGNGADRHEEGTDRPAP